MNRYDFKPMDLPQIECDLQSLSSSLHTGNFRVSLRTATCVFEMLFMLKEKRKPLMLLLSSGGRTDDSTRFHRWSMGLFSDFNALCVEDHMYRLHPGMTTGWYYGTRETSFLELFSGCLDLVLKYLEITPSQMVFIGSSSAGYAAIYLGNRFAGSCCIAMNPQIRLLNWGKIAQRAAEIIGTDFRQPDPFRRNNLAYVASNRSSRFLIVCSRHSKQDYDRQVKLLVDRLCPGKKIGNSVLKRRNFFFWLSDGRYVNPHGNVLVKSTLAILCQHLLDGTLSSEALYHLMREQERIWLRGEIVRNVLFWSRHLPQACIPGVRLTYSDSFDQVLLARDGFEIRISIVSAYKRVAVEMHWPSQKIREYAMRNGIRSIENEDCAVYVFPENTPKTLNFFISNGFAEKQS